MGLQHDECESRGVTQALGVGHLKGFGIYFET